MKRKLLIVGIVLILMLALTWRYSLIEHEDPIPESVQKGLALPFGGVAWAEETSEENSALSPGDRGEAVRKLQAKLCEMGFAKDTADGVFGQNTESAVRALRTYLEEIRREELRARAERLARSIEDKRAALSPEYTGARAEKVNLARARAEEMRAALSPESEPRQERGENLMQRILKPEFAPSGTADAALLSALAGDGVPAWRMDLTEGSEGAEVRRLQTRLYALNYLTEEPDGQFGAGTALALKAFQKKNGLPMDGRAGESTQELLYSGGAKAGVRPVKPYQLKVSTGKQRVYAYEWNVLDQGYTTLARTMVCSTGLPDTPTPKGTFTGTAPVARWGYFPKFDCWAQYLYRINGSILFHSVLYDAANEDTVRWGSVSKLGSRASHGCVRLSVEDARWIYNHCGAGTAVTVY